MIPYPASGLKMLADRVLTTVLPELGNQFVMSDTALLAMLVTALSEELESGIAKRMTDIEEMRSILAEAEQQGFDVKNFELLPWEQMTSTAVNKLHDNYTRTLIELHGALKQGDQDLDHAIWRYLEATAERHQLPI